MIYIFDVDGVLANFRHGYNKVCAERFGTPMEYEVVQWDTNPPGLTREQEATAWLHIQKTPAWWVSLDPLISQDTFHKIDELVDYHDVYFVTNRYGPFVKRQTEDWLKHFGIWRPTVIISKDKGDVAHALRADVLIDDKAGNVVAVQYLSRKTKPFILDAPYNRWDSTVVGTKVVRVSSVEEFLIKAEEYGKVKA